jgi:hypothetical protein
MKLIFENWRLCLKENINKHIANLRGVLSEIYDEPSLEQIWQITDIWELARTEAQATRSPDDLQFLKQYIVHSLGEQKFELISLGIGNLIVLVDRAVHRDAEFVKLSGERWYDDDIQQFFHGRPALRGANEPMHDAALKYINDHGYDIFDNFYDFDDIEEAIESAWEFFAGNWRMHELVSKQEFFERMDAGYAGLLNRSVGYGKDFDLWYVNKSDKTPWLVHKQQGAILISQRAMEPRTSSSGWQ